MLLELEASSPADGWAIVAENGDFYLVRPPYRLAQRQRLREGEVPSAMRQLDLRAEGTTFADWRELILHLRREMARRSDPDLSQQAAEASRRILARASAEDVHRLLGEVEARLDGGDWRGAERSVDVLIDLQAVSADVELFRRCRRLQKRCTEARRREEQAREDLWGILPERQKWLETARAVYGPALDEMAGRIARRKQVLPIAA